MMGCGLCVSELSGRRECGGVEWSGVEWSGVEWSGVGCSSVVKPTVSHRATCVTFYQE